MKDTEIVWLPKKEAERYEAAISEQAQIAVIDEIIEAGKKSMRLDIEVMTEDEAMFKGMLLRYKKMYRETLEEHSKAVYKIWEDLDASLPTMKKQADVLKCRLEPMFKDIQEVTNLLDNVQKKMESINTYQLKNMVELIDTIQGCSDDTKQILIKVLNQ